MRLRHINAILLIAIILINGYIVLLPLLPTVSFWLEQRTDKAAALTAQLHPQVGAHRGSVAKKDSIIIPAMVLDEPIHTGNSLSVINNGGTWKRPNTSTPDKGGNTVIVAHRFTYAHPKGSFYYLNKLKKGDEIGVFWKGKRYLYAVATTKVVPANDVSVETPTNDTRLTLYTCTPLWLPKDRLVVTAYPVKELP